MNNIYSWAKRWCVPDQAIHELQLMSLPHVDRSGESHSLETDVSAKIRIRAAHLGVILLRNNSGVGVNPNGRPVRFGLGNDSKKINKVRKSSDLIGLAPNGQFIAIETKRSGWRYRATDEEVAQRNFLDMVIRMNGIAGFGQSVEDFERMLTK